MGRKSAFLIYRGQFTGFFLGNQNWL
jgi:hypothetical protein